MSDNERTPLEETFDLPSIQDVTKHFTDIRNDDKSQFIETRDIDSSVDEIEDYDDDGDSEEGEEEGNTSPLVLLDRIKTLTNKINNSSSIDEKMFKDRFENDMNDVFTTAMDSFKDVMSAALSMEASAGAKFLVGATKLLEIASSSKTSIMSQMIEIEKVNNKKMEITGTKPSMNSVSNVEDASSIEEDDDNDDILYSRNDLINNYRDIEVAESTDDSR